MGSFPLNLGVGDVSEFQSCGTIQELDILEVGAGCIVIEIVITTHFVASSETSIVNEGNIEPLFIAHHPSSLQ